MKRLLLLGVAALCSFVVNAQLLTWTPPFPKEDDPSQTLVITVDATAGNKGLLNYTPATDVYVHTGVITNKSQSAGDWKYVKFNQDFNQPNSALQATYVSGTKWKFNINGSLRAYYGITDPTEKILKIAILFRTGNGQKKQANGDGTDMYVPVYGSNLAVRIDEPISEPKFIPVPEKQNWVVGTSFTIKANASSTSSIKLYHNGTVFASAANVSTLSGTSAVTAAGNQQIIAEATNGTTATYDTLNVFIAPTSNSTAPLPPGVTDGVNYEPGDTSAILVLRAPGKNMATVIGDFSNWTQTIAGVMNKTPDGKFFWLRVHPLTPGKEYAYQFVVDDTIKIADPYAEKILDPYNNNDQYIPASVYPNLKPYPAGQTGIVSLLQTGQSAYQWKVNNFSRPDKRGLVIYEMLVRDFVAAHDWKTIQDSIGYFKRLGINAIELMPFNEFEGNSSWGYNPDFYFSPDKYYGTKNALKSFIDACHQQGIAVIMDIALNHSFGLSPMVQLYWDAANNRPAANNPWFNPAPKHAFNVGFDMNHESAETHYFVSRVVEHWLKQYKIDGFRFDLSKGFTQKQTCDANGNSCNVDQWGAYDASRVAIWKGYYDTLQKKSAGSYAILEHFADNTEEKLLSEYGMLLWGNMNYNYSEAAMGYVANSDLSGGIYTSRGWTQPHLVTYMESHDEERIVFKCINYGNAAGSYNIRDTATALKRMELDAAFLFTIPGPKMIWQFGELGYPYSINTCENGSINNDCRLSPKPIRWDYLKDPRRKEVFDTYSSLIKLRFHPWYKSAFISAKIEQSLGGAFKWIKVTTDTSNLLVVGNFDVTAKTGTVTFQNAGTWYNYLDSSNYTATGTTQSITLQPGEFHVYVNRNVHNTSATPVQDVNWDLQMLQVSAYPNPVNTDFTVGINMPQSGQLNLSLYNSVGQFVSTVHSGFMGKGKQKLSLVKPAVAAGTYFLKANIQSGTKTIVITIQ